MVKEVSCVKNVKEDKMKMSVLYLAVLVLIGLMIAVFPSIGCKEAVAGKRVVIFQGWVRNSFPDYAVQMQKNFETAYPNIKIQFRDLSYEDTFRQLVLNCTAGNPPDLAYVDPSMLPPLYSIGAIGDITPYLTKKLIDNMMMKEAHTINGILVAACWEPTPYAFFSNKVLLKKVGYGAPPQSIAEVAEAAKKVADLGVAESGNKVWGLCIAGKRGIHLSYLFAPWLYNFGAEFIDSKGKAAINSPEAVACFKWFKDLYDHNGALGPTPIDRETPRQMFAHNELAMQGEGAWQRGLYRRMSGQGKAFDNCWWVTPYPSLTPGKWGKSIAYSQSLAIPTGAKHKEEAKLLLQFLLSDRKTAEYMFKTQGMTPGQIDMLTDPVYQDKYTQTFVLQSKIGGKIPYGVHAENSATLFSLFGEAWEDIIIGGANIKTRLDQLARDFNIANGELK